jgi:GDP-D-mannose 3',5'-epimerase
LSSNHPNSHILITGAGGFIGGHLVAYLRGKGIQSIRAVDLKPLDSWYQRFDDVENLQLDLRNLDSCRLAAKGMVWIYNLAADMGGMGFIELHKADCMLSVLINTHMLLAAHEAGVSRFLFSSSACVYSANKQTISENPGLKESDAYPAMPEDGYGWEKLFSERMCRHFHEDFGLDIRIVRYHNVYGPYGTYDGGREKAPAAICRKIIYAQSKNSNVIEIWGDGEQTRSFMYIDDCIKGTTKIMESDIVDPINLGSAEIVSINQLVDMVEKIAGSKLTRIYKHDAPKGVRGRCSDNTLIKKLLEWEPNIPLSVGLIKTFDWIKQEIQESSSKGLNRFI